MFKVDPTNVAAPLEPVVVRVIASCLLLKVFQSVELRNPSVEPSASFIPIVPVVVIVPPVIGAVVAIDVTVPVPPPPPEVSIVAVEPEIVKSPLLTFIVVIGLPLGDPPTVVTVRGGCTGPDITHHTWLATQIWISPFPP